MSSFTSGTGARCFLHAVRSGLVFLDGGGFKHAPDELGDLVFGLLEPGGLLVMDDLTPGRAEPDPVRAWAHSHSGLRAAEVLTTPSTAALVIARA